jgi:hypothetical protein
MGEDARQDRRDAAVHPSTERVSVPQAADHLGTTVDAIRKRVQRGAIPYEKDAAGRVWILLDTGRPRHDATGHRQDAGGELADELRDRIRYLERQVEEEREARRRADTLLAQLAKCVPQLEAPETPEPRSDSPSSTEAEAGGGPETTTERPEERSWWRRRLG